MATVFIVEHERPETDDCWEDVKFIGVFSSETTARAAVEKLREQPGFADYPDGFSIEEHTIDQFGWEEGFIEGQTRGEAKAK
jgi:hypothetical protein